MTRPLPAELFELTESGQLLSPTLQTPALRYLDGSIIDWLQEEANERERINIRRAQHGVRGILLPWSVIGVKFPRSVLSLCSQV